MKFCFSLSGVGGSVEGSDEGEDVGNNGISSISDGSAVASLLSVTLLLLFLSAPKHRGHHLCCNG
jgi:hypothetical protein